MISKALRLLRRFKGLSQTEMANQLGVTKSWISEIEGGKKEPTMALLQSYARVLDIPASSILFFSEQFSCGGSSEKVRTFVSRKVLAIMDYIDAHSEVELDEESPPSSPPRKTVPSLQAR